MQIDERKRLILQTVVDEYIRTGEPVGSNAVLSRMGMNVSSATVRNDMAFLERLGLLEQPHTSAGRIPTYEGYRFYIDHLMAPKPLSPKEKRLIDSLLSQNDLTVDSVVDNAVSVLAELTSLAVVSKSNAPVFSVITRVEVIPAGRRLYALLMITSAGAVRNKICRIDFDLNGEQLEFFERFINDHLDGLNVDSLTPAMLQSLAVGLGSYMIALSPLLRGVYQLSEELSKADVSLRGEQNLLTSGSLRPDEVVRLLSNKEALTGLLGSAFDGISVVFGEEGGSFAVSNSSLIVSPYKIGRHPGGSLGVIGPIRVDYAKVIPHIQYITESVTRLLSDVIGGNSDGKDGSDE